MGYWLIRKFEDLPSDQDPWNPQIEKPIGFIVSADTEDQARNYANSRAGDEKYRKLSNSPWLNPKFTLCINLEETQGLKTTLEQPWIGLFLFH